MIHLSEDGMTLTLTGMPTHCSQRALPKYLGGHLGQRLAMDMGSQVYGTLNVDMDKDASELLSSWPRTRVVHGFEPVGDARRNELSLYLCELEREGIVRAGWVVVQGGWRRKGDRIMLSIASREPFPTDLLDGTLKMTMFQSWGPKAIQRWSQGKTWFQTYGWSPKIRANSALVWQVIRNTVPVSGRTLLDIGCSSGYHTIHASKDGALATGADVSRGILSDARAIARHIEMSDANFVHISADNPVPSHAYDVILYLSVAHYESQDYSALKPRLAQLRRFCHDLIVEVITPPLTGTMSVNRLERIIGGQRLLAYEHRLHGRRERRMYHVRGKC